MSVYPNIRAARAALGAVLLLVGGTALAEPAALTPEFQLSPDSTVNHSTAEFVHRSGGGFVAAWYIWSSPDESDIVAQVFSESGAPASPLVQVNQARDGVQILTSVGVDSAGNFVVVWRSNDPGPDYTSIGIFARRFDANGGPLGDEFQVNAEAPRSAQYMDEPTVAMAPDGRFVVAWTKLNDVYARLYDASGNARGPQFVVSAPNYSQALPDVAMHSDGSFVVAYASMGNNGGEIRISGYDASGVARYSKVRVNELPADPTSEWQSSPAIAMSDDGAFQVLWARGRDTGNNTWRSDAMLRRFDAAGTARGAPIQVNAPDEEIFGAFPAIGVDAHGATTVAWADADDSTLLARSYDRYGNADGEPFVVSSGLPTDYAGFSSRSIAFDASGGFLATWYRGGQNMPSTVFGRFYEKPLEIAPPAEIGSTNAGAFAVPSLLLLSAAALRRRRRYATA